MEQQIPETTGPVPSTQIPLQPAANVRMRWPEVAIALLLAAIAFAIYWPVRDFSFINFDDAFYVGQNVHVKAGLSWDSLKWAFTDAKPYWFPITRLSWLVDSSLFGMSPRGFHVGNAAFHCVAAALLFVFLFMATGTRWRSAFVAGVFALHPVHIESVAWVSERSDDVCAVLFFLTLIGWTAYVRTPTRSRYLGCLGLFVFALLAKGLVIPLPLVLLALDQWPFRRGFSAQLVYEKVPFAVLAVVSTGVTYVAQLNSGAVGVLASATPLHRLENSVVSLAMFVGQYVWPTRLSLLYRYPEHIAAAELAVAAMLLAGITLAVMSAYRARPCLAVGWIWFVAFFIPTIGLVQVGERARTDHTAYLPYEGLSIMVVWGLASLVRLRPWAKIPSIVLCLGACAAFGYENMAQLPLWRRSEPLLRRAIELDDSNYVAWRLLAETLLDLPGGTDEAIAAARKCARLSPDKARGHRSLGTFLLGQNHVEEGIAELRTALRLNPDLTGIHGELGTALLRTDDPAGEALVELKLQLKHGPPTALIHHNIAFALGKLGRIDEAMSEFEAALRLDPADIPAHRQLGTRLLLKPGQATEAVEHLAAAVKADPNDKESQLDLGVALSLAPGLGDPVEHMEAAIRIDPNYTTARVDLAKILAGRGDLPGAIAQVREALRIKPDPTVEKLLAQLEQRAAKSTK